MILLGGFNSYAQLTANAGNDTISCVGIDTIALGYTPTASGGIPPYSYLWETSYTIGSNTFYASTFLNDTTLANPLLITPLSNMDTLTFKLTVTDGLNNTDIDSIIIVFSQFNTLLVDNFVTINQGDSVQLTHTTSGGIPPLTFAWFPNYNLSDSTYEYPWAKPDTTTYYNCIIVDAAGCQTINGDVYEVYVDPLGIEENVDSKFVLYPNPSVNEIIIKYKNDNSKYLTIEMYNSSGKLELNRKMMSLEKTVISTYDFPAGIYFISIKDDRGIIATKKWIKTE